MDVSALAGGALIGFSAALFWLLNGRIAGVSGMVSRVVEGNHQAVAFVAGLFSVGMVLAWSNATPSTRLSGVGLAVVAGALVGAGTFLANGCTSGHGVIGISRLSRRSIVATCVFMVAAGVTVLVRGWL